MTPAGSLSAAPDTMPGPMTRKNCRHDRRWCSRRARALVATAHTVRSLQAAGARSLLPPRGRPRKHTRPAALDAPPASLLRSRYPRSRLRDIQVAFVGTRPPVGRATRGSLGAAGPASPPLRYCFGGRSLAVAVFRRDRRVLARIVPPPSLDPAGGLRDRP